PGLQAQVAEPQLGVQEVEVVVLALGRVAAQLQALGLGVGPDLEGEAGLDAAEDAEQPLGDAVGRGDGQGAVLLALGAAGQVDDGPAVLLGQAEGGGADGVGQPQGEVLEVLEQDLGLPEVGLQAADVGQEAQAAAEADAVQAAEGALDDV